MKAKVLAKLLGITHRFNYESALYQEGKKVHERKDFLVDQTPATNAGHLD